MGSISLRHFLKVHLEDNSIMVGAFVHKMVAQRAFSHPEYSDHHYLPLWEHKTKPNWRQGSLLSLVLPCKQPLRDFLGEKVRVSRDQDVVVQCWGGKAWSPLCGYEFCTKHLLKQRCWQNFDMAEARGDAKGSEFGLVNFSLISVTFSSFINLLLGHSSESLEVKEPAPLCFSAHEY